MSYPIAMTTYERPEYFGATLKNMKENGTDLSHLHIFDDCSEDPLKKLLLEQAKKDYKEVHINERRLGTYLNTWQAIDRIYTLYPDDFLAYCQDDINVVPGWIFQGQEIFRKALSAGHKLAILSLFHWQGDSEAEYYILSHGHKGAVAWIINRVFWEEFRKTFAPREQELLLDVNARTDVRSNSHICDYKICHCAHLMKWVIGYTGKSYVDHVGDRSTLTKRSMNYTRAINMAK